MSSPNLYQRLSERVGVSDNLMVMNVIVNKAMSNLKVWSRHEEIVDKSLLLFHELASGYSSSKTLSKLEVVTYTLRNHGPQQLPFLNESGNPRHRTTFYTTLTRILLMDDQGHMEFEHFMAPFAPVLQHLQAFLSNPANAGPGPARDEARGAGDAHLEFKRRVLGRERGDAEGGRVAQDGRRRRVRRRQVRTLPEVPLGPPGKAHHLHSSQGKIAIGTLIYAECRLI